MATPPTSSSTSGGLRSVALHEFNATIARPSGFGVVVRYRPGLAKPLRQQATAIDALVDDCVDHGCGTGFRQGEVVVEITGVVGMAIDRKLKCRILVKQGQARKRVDSGKGVSVRVDCRGRGNI